MRDYEYIPKTDRETPPPAPQKQTRQAVTERVFGPYLLEVSGNHATIRREDGQPCEPTFYEMQHMKNMAFHGDHVAVEVYPRHKDLVDGQHHRHLWLMDDEAVPNLHTGHMVQG